MSDKPENSFPTGGLDPETITNDPDLLLDAAKALNDQIADELADEIPEEATEEAVKEPVVIEKAQVDPAVGRLAAQADVGVQGDDPVRLYLKDIGSIELLDVNHEFWLAARMAAIRRLDIIGRQHPMASDADSPQTRIFRALFEETVTAWTRMGEDTVRLG